MKDWRARLQQAFEHSSRGEKRNANLEESRRQVAAFVANTVVPAFEELREELRRHGRDAVIERDDRHAAITVLRDDEEEFSYAVRGRVFHRMRFAFPMHGGGDEEPVVIRAEVAVKAGKREREVAKLTREAIIEDFLHEYVKWMGW